MNRTVSVAESTYIVEDHDLVRAALTAWFAYRGHRVHACDPLDLIELESAVGRESVVIDLCLGESDDVDVLKYIADRKFAGRILLINAFPEAVINSARDVAAEFGLDIVGTLRKPVGFDRLDRLLELAPRRAGRRVEARRGDDSTLAQALAAGRVTFHHQPILDAARSRSTASSRWRG